MRVKLTGIIELLQEFEIELDENEVSDAFEGVDMTGPDAEWAILQYLKESEQDSEIWATSPNDLNKYDVWSTEFTDVEVLR